MTSREILVVIILLCISASILGYYFNRYKQTKRMEIEKQLHADAQEYFVTICHKYITKFGSESDANEYYSFFIIENFLMVEHRKREFLSDKVKIVIVISARFEGSQIVDQKSDKTYGWEDFEVFLTKFLGNELVYSSYVRYLWNQLQKQVIK